MGETSKDAAIRECMEETHGSAQLEHLLAVYDIVAAGQVQIVYAGVLEAEEDVKPGEESQEVRLFGWGNIPWWEIKLTTHRWALEYASQCIHSSRSGLENVVPDLRVKPVGFVDELPR